MTLSPAEIELSPDAAARLEDYLRQVRVALAGAADVNPDEIEADIREHMENELRSAPRPIALAALEAVLTRLGPPSQWGTTNDPTLLHRARHLLREKLRGAKTSLADRVRIVWGALWRGPEDWRLAYLSFGIFALGTLTAFVFPLTLLISYILSRAGIALAQEKGIELGAARKWLLYPPVVIVSLALFIALVAWPVMLAGATHAEVERARNRVSRFYAPTPLPNKHTNLQADHPAWREYPQLEDDRKLLTLLPVAPQWGPAAAAWFVGVGAVALWWMILGVAATTYPHTARAVFFPLFNRFKRRHGMWLAVLCLLVLIPWGVVAYEVVAGLM